PSMSFMVNRQAWDQLPSSYQTAFETAALHAMNGTQTIYDTKNPEALARLIAGGTQLRRYPDDVMAAAAQATRELLEQYAAADASYRRIYEAFTEFRTNSYRWFGTAEHEFARFSYG
ncbi:MAG TPA: ABC transporter substrate-binding protein, partial [Longimicrobiales bacterium]|nr:ABC transporter substrate-binding protein [Longimicrobiales bacterium]